MNDIDNDNRFTWNKGEIGFIDEDGNTIEDVEYFKKRNEGNLTVFDKLDINDVVKLKGTGRNVVVKFIDYKFNDYIRADYAGTLYNTDSEDLILFGQEDILEIYDISKVEISNNKTK